MEFEKVIVRRRTRRKFTSEKVSCEKLEKILEFARFTPMGANLQALKYAVINDDLAQKVFPHTKWSGYHPEAAPSTEEQPPSYIAILGDKNIKTNNFETDAGAAGTVILLAAENMGLAACWLGAINRDEISKILNLDSNFELLYLIAIGYSNQKATYIDAENDIKYFTDDNDILTVPKRKLKDILVEL